jgi:hypothetical protein
MKKRYVTLSLFGLIIGLLLFSLAGCASGPSAVPPPTRCTSFAGTWNTDAGPVEFTQDECYVMGTFPSPLRFHTIRGAARGNMLEFDWEGPLGTGRGLVTMDETGNAFVGTFGYGTEVKGGTFSGVRGTWPGR